MQTITGKELANRKVDLAESLESAVQNHYKAETFVGAVLSAQKAALWFAAISGHYLLKCKRLVPTGDWWDWLQLNFCATTGASKRTAQRYMLIATVNAKPLEDVDAPRVALSEPDPEILSRFQFDTIRKHAITFVPEKTQPEHKGNVKFPRLATFLNIANEYRRLKYRHMEGLQAIDFQEAREETVDLYAFLKWLHGDGSDNPLA